MLDKRRLRSFLLGGLTGVLAGILLAPKSGKETRGTISDRVGETHERGRERYFDTREGMRERFSATREGTARPHQQTRAEANPEAPAEEKEVRERPGECPGECPGERPVLRDVSRDAPADGDGGGGEEVSRSEELRRKVKETRDRLRSRAEGPMGRGGDGDEK